MPVGVQLNAAQKAAEEAQAKAVAAMEEQAKNLEAYKNEVS